MATGFTYPVKEGKITEFREFALSCARAFGALIEMRDESMDAPIREPQESQYHSEALEAAETKLKDLAKISMGEAARRADIEYTYALEQRANYIAEATRENIRFDAMMGKVLAWAPPTRDHDELKRFMMQQLRDSRHTALDYPEPKHLSAAKWLEAQVEKAKNDITYHTKHVKEERALVAERVQWIRQLKESLK